MTSEAAVLAAARQRAVALAGQDENVLRELLHPDFCWISHTGVWYDRDSYLDSNCTGSNVWHGQELRDPEVRVVADTAVLRCLVVDTVDVGSGQPERFIMPMTQTWVRHDHRWTLLAGHAGPRISESRL